jgi:hypothetical protein
MNISIRFRGPIAREIKDGILEIELEDGLILQDLFIKMIEHNSYLQTLWKAPAEIDRDSMILCNEVDILAILPLVHGG